MFGLYTQLTGGHIVTGMRDNVVWGIYIVNFIFFMGVSYAGALISGVLHLFKTSWRKPIIRISELITVVSLLIGPVFILFCVGRFESIPYLIIYPRIQSPIMWDVIAISTDLVGCFIFLYLSFLEDMAHLRDNAAGLKFAAMEKKTLQISGNWIYGYSGSEKIALFLTQCDGCHDHCHCDYCLLCTGLDLRCYITTRLAQHHFWPLLCNCSSIFRYRCAVGIDVDLSTNLSPGTTTLRNSILLMLVFLLFIVGAFYGYFTFSDYLTKWYGSVKMDKLLIDKLFRDYYWMFIFSNYVGVLLPMIIIAIQPFTHH